MATKQSYLDHCTCGECKQCNYALQGHRYWIDGPGSKPAEQEPAAVRRGRSLAKTERFSAAEIRAAYREAVAQ